MSVIVSRKPDPSLAVQSQAIVAVVSKGGERCANKRREASKTKADVSRRASGICI
jgi:hypothetical protein